MKKKYFYATALALMMAGGVNAQNLLRPVPRPVGPRVEFSTRSARPIHALVQKKNHKQENYKPFANIPKAPVAPSMLNEQPIGEVKLDTILLTKQEEFRNDEVRKRASISYDEYGLRKSFVKEQLGNDPKVLNSFRYKYVIGAFNYWTSRFVEYQDRDGQWFSYSKEDRDFDNQRHLIFHREYDVNYDTKEPQIMSESKYDYAHEYVDPYQSNVKRLGALVSEKLYNDDGKLASEVEYKWFEPAKAYLMSSAKNENNERIEVEFKDDEVIKRTWVNDLYTNQERLESEEHEYYGNRKGRLEINYDFDGSVGYTNGRCKELLKNVPSAGCTTLTEYDFDSDSMEWIPSMREVRKGYDLETDDEVKGVDFETQRLRYDLETKQWDVYYTLKGEWLGKSLCHFTYTDSKGNLSSEDYEVYDISDDGMGYVFHEVSYHADTKTYERNDGEAVEEDGVWVDYIYTYDLNDNLVREIKTHSWGEDEIKYAVDFCQAFIKKNGQWKPLDKYSETYYDSYLKSYVNTEFIFNDHGYILEINEKLIKDGKKSPLTRVVYEYQKKGYIVKEYEMYDSGNGVMKEGTPSVEEYLQLENGDYQFTYFDYAENEFQEGGRRVETTDNITIVYRYDEATKEFIETERMAGQLESYDEKTGIYTNIQRTIDENGKAVNYAKFEYKDLDGGQGNYNAQYYWNAENNMWVGSDKSFSYPVNFKVDYKPFVDPLVYDDESKYPQIPGYESSEIMEPELTSEGRYEWDTVKNDWRPIQVYLYELVSHSGNEYVVKKEEWGGYDQTIYTYTIRLNDDKQVTHVLKNTKSVSENGETSERKESKDFAINDYGYVTKKKVTYYSTDGTVSSVETVVNTYENASLEPTSIANAKGEEVLRVNGLHLSAPDSALIEVYGLDGRHVATAQGALTLPTAGVYIVKCNGISVKVSCR